MKAINARTGFEYNDSMPYQVRNGAWYEFRNFNEMYEHLIENSTPSNIRYKGANIKMVLNEYLDGEDHRNMKEDFLFGCLESNIETRVNRYGVY